MAWRSSGRSNDELVTALQINGVLEDLELAHALRAVDRGFFMPPEVGEAVYRDSPLRIGNLHLSAPHMYATALETLAMRPGCSFLNIGSGTGYVSTVMAFVAEKGAVHHSIEVKQEVHDFAVERCKTFAAANDAGADSMAQVQFYCGNVFDVDLNAAMKYDRIYVGAGCPANKQADLTGLLAVGGILVGPFDDELLKIQRLSEDPDSVTVQRITGVCFAPLVPSTSPALSLRLPIPMWHQDTHVLYPKQFRDSVRTLLLVLQRPGSPLATLPKHLVPEILSFTSREWFTPELTEVERLRMRLHREVAARRQAEERALTAERLRMEAERQREMYQFLCQRLCATLQHAGGDAALPVGVEPFAAVFGLDLGGHDGAASDDASSDEEDAGDEEDADELLEEGDPLAANDAQQQEQDGQAEPHNLQQNFSEEGVGLDTEMREIEAI